MKRLIMAIEKHTKLYLAWLLIMVLFWIWIFGFFTRISAEEKVSVFVGAYSHSFEAYGYINEKAYLPEYIRTVEVNVHSVEEDAFEAMLQVFGYGEADILILPESYIQFCIHHYSPISVEYQNLFYDMGCDLGWYEEQGIVYGIQVYDKNSDQSLMPYLEYTQQNVPKENFYLLFNLDSLHTSNLSGEKQQNLMDAAIIVAKRMFSYEEN